ncbi:MAG: AbrB/MazE/SpoVT family DNA-binding domain-containing protein [Treponema sp.]|nr:AbrB/MazE/SpoVT family DNA-binding domain-containing protein [Treponema sp.]
MEAIVRKWGNSLGIRIPNIITREFSLKDGSHVSIDEKDNKIVIFPIKKIKLSEMIKNINEENLHGEIDTGKSVGKEVW